MNNLFSKILFAGILIAVCRLEVAAKLGTLAQLPDRELPSVTSPIGLICDSILSKDNMKAECSPDKITFGACTLNLNGSGEEKKIELRGADYQDITLTKYKLDNIDDADFKRVMGEYIEPYVKVCSNIKSDDKLLEEVGKQLMSLKFEPESTPNSDKTKIYRAEIGESKLPYLAVLELKDKLVSSIFKSSYFSVNVIIPPLASDEITKELKQSFDMFSKMTETMHEFMSHESDKIIDQGECNVVEEAFNESFDQEFRNKIKIKCNSDSDNNFNVFEFAYGEVITKDAVGYTIIPLMKKSMYSTIEMVKGFARVASEEARKIFSMDSSTDNKNLLVKVI